MPMHTPNPKAQATADCHFFQLKKAASGGAK